MTEYTPDLHLEQLLSGLSPAGFPAGSSAPNHNEWSHQQQEAPVSASVSLPHVHPFTQDMQIDPFLLMDAPQPVQQEETRMAKRKSPEPQPQQSAPPAKSTTSRTQRMGPTTTVLPHIGRIRRLQRTSKGRYRTIERPVLSEDLTNALLQGEGEQHDQAVETLREAGTLEYCQALVHRTRMAQQQIQRAKSIMTQDLRAAQIEETILRHALDMINKERKARRPQE